MQVVGKPQGFVKKGPRCKVWAGRVIWSEPSFPELLAVPRRARVPQPPTKSQVKQSEKKSDERRRVVTHVRTDRRTGDRRGRTQRNGLIGFAESVDARIPIS